MALCQRYISHNLPTSQEQRYWKIHFDGCFWEHVYFGNIPEWLLLKTTATIYLLILIVKQTSFYGFFLGQGFGEKRKHTQLPIHFTRKQFFSEKDIFSLHFSEIPTPWISKMLFLNFLNFKFYPETSMCVVAAYLFIEHWIDVFHVLKVNCNSTVLGFLRSRWFFIGKFRRLCHMDLV